MEKVQELLVIYGICMFHIQEYSKSGELLIAEIEVQALQSPA